jgi:hypothetical protein
VCQRKVFVFVITMTTQDRGERMRKLVSHYFVSLRTTFPNPTDELRILSEIAYLERKILFAFEELEYMMRISNPLTNEVIEHLLKQGFRYWFPIKGDISITNESYMLLPGGKPIIPMVGSNKMRDLVEYTSKPNTEKDAEPLRKCVCGSDLHVTSRTTTNCCLCFESKDFKVIDCEKQNGGIFIWNDLNFGMK